MIEMNKTVHILLVEDDQVDEKAFLRAIEKLRINNPVTVARDGVEAWAILKGTDDTPPLPRPNLLVLDINMPRMNGLELLERIRDDADLHDSIVFMLTTSNDDEDRIEEFDLNVAGYILKSDVGNSFIKAMELMNSYWRLVEFPGKSSHRNRGNAEDRRGYVRHPDSRGIL